MTEARTVTEATMATEAYAGGRPATATGRVHRGGTRSGDGPDRLTVALLSLAAFLTVLALLAGQFAASAAAPRPHRVVLLRTVYRTKVIQTLAGGSGPTSVSRSVTGPVTGASRGAGSTAAPTTRTS
jgi:hypothetical protein